jgi:protein ImuB
MSSPLWVALHLPSLSLEAWAAGVPSDDRPGALVADHVVQQADAAALALGVRPGMQRATALALAADLRLGQADAARDARALRAVAHVALGFSPSVTWLPVAGADDPPPLVGVRLEVRSCLRYWGGLPSLLQRLRDALAPLGHRVRIACAPTALGAALLAGWRDGLDQGPHVEDRAALQRLLDQLPLPLLVGDAARQQALAGMGLQRLADLRRLPRDGLARRFGAALLQRIDQARGHAPEAQAWLTLPPRFAARLELAHRADTTDAVLAGARVLLARLVAWVRAGQGCVLRFTLVLHHGPRHRSDSTVPTHTPLVIAPAQPSDDADHLQSLLAEHLARLPLPAPVLDLGLLCDERADAAPPNGELFGAGFASPESRRAGLAKLVERLQARLGTAQVLSLAPVPDHRPEHGTRWQPADPAHLGAATRGGSDVAQQARLLGAQPLWLLPQPQVLAERDAMPLLDGRPLQLLAGPQRLECGWWDGQPALRDYFIAQAAGGALVWVYRHRLPVGPGEPGWFLQGLFA